MTTTTAEQLTRPRRRAGALALGLSRGGLELKQFVRTREYLMFTLLLPVIIVVIFGAVFTFPIGNGVKLSQYFVTGMIASTLLSTGFQNLAIQIPIERDRGV